MRLSSVLELPSNLHHSDQHVAICRGIARHPGELRLTEMREGSDDQHADCNVAAPASGD